MKKTDYKSCPFCFKCDRQCVRACVNVCVYCQRMHSKGRERGSRKDCVRGRKSEKGNN